MAEAVKPRRIIDISNPGETAPNTSSRPILISDKPSVQDPMVSATASNKPDNPPTESLPVSQASAQPAAAPVAPAEPSIQPEPAETTQPDVKQLVHDKTYFMPVSQPPRRHGLSWIFIPLVIILAIAVYIFLII